MLSMLVALSSCMAGTRSAGTAGRSKYLPGTRRGQFQQVQSRQVSPPRWAILVADACGAPPELKLAGLLGLPHAVQQRLMVERHRETAASASVQANN